MELGVVVLIIGILASIGVPYYMKTVENSKADGAAATTNMVASANRMYFLDNNAYAPGAISSSHPLVVRRYLADQNWACAAYNYSADNSGGASATRNCSPPSGCNAATCNPTYGGWGYIVSNTGVCSAIGGAPSCPVF